MNYLDINEQCKKLKIKLDKWQEEIIQSKEKLIAIRAGRQVGKSTVVSLKAALYALQHPKKTVLIIASVDRQAQLLFEKVVETILVLDRKQVGIKKNKPTKHHMKLKNGTHVYCLPTGRSGYGIRGYTIDLLIADEAAFIPQEVWTAVVPMLATTKGNIILLSTPMGMSGYFYECFNDPEYKTWAVSSEDCSRITKEFLEKQKKRMTLLEYAQEFKGEFLEELTQFFSSTLIEQTLTLDPLGIPPKNSQRDYYLGVDIARYGGDENAFAVLQYNNKDSLEVVSVETTSNITTTDTLGRIIDLHRIYKFKKIYLDDGGLGAPILDFLLEHNETKRVVVGLNNASRSISREKKKRLLKEDLYGNLLRLMEQSKIKIIKDAAVARSLASIQFEYTTEGNLKIFGRYTHITEAIIRCAWCSMAKGLNIYVH